AFAFAAANAQQLQQGELPTPLSERTLSTRFENLSIQHGLSQSTVFDILQDHNGFMWFATYDGVNRFDGYDVKQFRNIPFDSTSLGPGWAYGISEDSAGHIWVGQTGGISVFDPVTETFKRYRYDPADSTGLGGYVVGKTLEDRQGRIWAVLAHELDLMDAAREGHFTHFRHNPNDPSSLSDDNLWTIYMDAGGYLWIGTQNGLNRLDPRSPFDGFKRYLTDKDVNTETGTFIRGILERSEVPGTLWLGTEKGLVKLDVESADTETYPPPSGFKGGAGAIAQDPADRNVLWVNLQTGLGRFDVRAKHFTTYSGGAENPNGFSGDPINTVYADRSGLVWIGTESHGVDRFNPSTVGLALYRADPENPSLLPSAAVWDVLKDDTGLLWVVTAGADQWQLTRINRSTRTAVHFRNRPSDPTSLPKGAFFKLAEDDQGTIWLGMGSGGLFTIDRKTSRFHRVSFDPDTREAVGVLYVDRAGGLWIGTSARGLFRRDPETGKLLHFEHHPDDPQTLSLNNVYSVLEDRAGFLWVGTRGAGLNRMVPETGVVTRYVHDENDPSTISHDQVSGLLERRVDPGVIWIGTEGGGLNRLDPSTGEIKHYLESDGLANNVIYGMLEDERGRIWMSTNNGLSRFDPDTETFRNYGLEIGLQGLEFNGQAAYRDADGEMFFGGPNGLNAFYPNELTENTSPPQVVIVDLKLSNRSIKETGAIRLDVPIAEAKEIHLQPDQKELTLDFV
ncbi:MAG: two-component regulator propeller domain-containing protein, partial [Rhodothermales bacterium]